MHVIGDLSRVNARRYPGKVALVHGERSLTYRQLEERSNQLAHALIHAGVKPGERVAILALNCIEYALVSQGVAKAGAILVPVNYRLVPSELAHVMSDSEPSLLMTEASFVPALTETFEKLVRPPRVVMIDAADATMRAIALDDFIAPHPTTAPSIAVDPRGACVLIYTSGTTGFPKGVLLPHESYLRMYIATAIDTGLRHDDVFLMAIPMFHMAGLHLMMHQALFLGASGIIHRGTFDPAVVFPLMERHRVSMTVLAPTHIAMLAQHPARKQHDLSSWRVAFYGSMPMPPAVLTQAMREFPRTELHQLYGSTESGMLSVLRWADHSQHAHSSGREALFSEMRIVDEQGCDVGVGEIGEVIGTQATGMLCYWRNEKATRETLRDGWIHTGDRARRDADGFFLIVGRIKEMIISGGENIYPAEVEKVLVEHPAVREAAVFGLPDAIYGESVCAAVVFHDGMRAPADELDQLCRSRLAGYKRPRRYEVMDALPRNASDKIQKSELKKRFSAERVHG